MTAPLRQLSDTSIDLPRGLPFLSDDALIEASSGDGDVSMTALSVPPAAGLEAARRLIGRGMVEAAQRLLRDLPTRAASRYQRVSLTVDAASLDPEFRHHVAAADSARDRGDWALAEKGYWRALQIFPDHPGYLVQYGHALKEQGKLPDAEVIYRSARALGAPPGDVDEHILFVAAAQGHAGALPAVQQVPPAHPLDLAPTRGEVATLFALMLHREPAGMSEVRDVMRTAPTCRDVALSLARRDEFRPANRALLILLAEQA